MEYVQLGNTGIKVSRLGFGCMTFKDVEQSTQLLLTARNAGVNYFDNAEFYGSPAGTAEILFGQAYKRLKDKYPVKFRRSDMVITTKIFFGPNDKVTFFDWNTFGQNELGLSRKHLMEGIDASLKRMQLQYVDVVYAHRFEDLTPMKEIVEGFTDIIKSGKAFYWGTSQWPAHKIIEAYWTAKKFNLIPPVVEQPKYSMLERKYLEGEYLSVFNPRYNIATTIWGALDSGILTGKHLKGVVKGSRMDEWKHFYGDIPKEKHVKVVKLMEIAQELGTTVTNLSLAWCLKNNNVTVILLGARTIQQLKTTLTCQGIVKKLTKKIMDRIESVLNNKPIPDPMLYTQFKEKRTFISKL